MFTMDMKIIESIKKRLTTGGRTYEYVCRDCGEEFESSQGKMADVNCPACNSTQIRSATWTQ